MGERLRAAPRWAAPRSGSRGRLGGRPKTPRRSPRPLLAAWWSSPSTWFCQRRNRGIGRSTEPPTTCLSLKRSARKGNCLRPRAQRGWNPPAKNRSAKEPQSEEPPNRRNRRRRNHLRRNPSRRTPCRTDRVGRTSREKNRRRRNHLRRNPSRKNPLRRNLRRPKNQRRPNRLGPDQPEEADLVRRINGPAGTSPEHSKWSFDTGGEGWGNEELESYTSRPANAELNGEGDLAITARAEKYKGAEGITRDYTSAKVQTLNTFKFKYGLAEVHIEVPAGQGLVAQFWMLGQEAYELEKLACVR